MSTIHPPVLPYEPSPPGAHPAIQFLDEVDAVIPGWVNSIQAFRAWAKSDEFPRHGRFSYAQETIWVDLVMEQLFTHGTLKGEISGHLNALIKFAKMGYFFFDRSFFTNLAVGLSTEPDGMFVSHRFLDLGLARLVEGAKEGDVEVEGSVDMVLEVISSSSVRKDTQVLPALYHRAEVTELWLVDARKLPLSFQIMKWTQPGYEAIAPTERGIFSPVFNRLSELRHELDHRGKPIFTITNHNP